MATDSDKKCPCCKKMVPFLQPIYDARGIYVDGTCGDDACEAKIKAKYRPEIFENPNYCPGPGEQIEEDY